MRATLHDELMRDASFPPERATRTGRLKAALRGLPVVAMALFTFGTGVDLVVRDGWGWLGIAFVVAGTAVGVWIDAARIRRRRERKRVREERERAELVASIEGRN